MIINELFAWTVTHCHFPGTPCTLTSFKWQLLHLNCKYPWYSVQDVYHLCNFLNTLDPNTPNHSRTLPPLCKIHCLPPIYSQFNMMYTISVLYYYHIAYCYHINIEVYTLQVCVYILDYVYAYTTLSEWYDIWYLHWFFNWYNETHLQEMYLNLHMANVFS